MRIELTIKTSYLPKWGIWEGIRELVQNAKDAETEFSAPMEVRYHKDRETLVIENTGTTLPHEALLLGFTSKQERSDMIGKFGEGLKLGILALVRAGVPVKIRSGSEVWVPRIVKSEKFNADVLAFDIHKNREMKERVQIEVGNINPESWETLRSKFLFLQRKSVHKEAEGDYGTILLDTKHVGCVFVRGIFVQHVPRLQYGYNMHDGDVDRDRKMIDAHQLRWRLVALWRQAMAARPDLIKEFTRMLDDQAEDLAGLEKYSAADLSEEVKAAAVKSFQKRYGENALPVSNLAESAEVEHFGAQGVVCPQALCAVLQSSLGTVEQNKEKLSKLPGRQYGWGEMTSEEHENLSSAIALVNTQEPVTLADVDVCDFKVDSFQGLYSDGRLMLAKKVLVDRALTLEVLVHETAHRQGGDGEKAHVARIEKIWAGIVDKLRGAS